MPTLRTPGAGVASRRVARRPDPDYKCVNQSSLPDRPMLNEIYNRRVLELAADIPLLGRLPTADASATVRSKLCGSVVTVDLRLEGETVTAFAQEVKACALGQASCAIMGRHVVDFGFGTPRDP